MVSTPRCDAAARRVGLATVVGILMGVLLSFVDQASVLAQRTGVHFEHAGGLSPGAIGRRQLQRGGPLRGYFQPVRIVVPEGSKVALASEGKFDRPTAQGRTASMLIAPVYRLRVTNIPLQEGREVYPTIEIVNRIYPPAGQKWRFTIPIELTKEDLTLALDGKFITRVIYLEPPASALPVATDGKHQEWFEIDPQENPLVVADRLGRPVAILRMGSRMPIDVRNPSPKFMYGSPPWRTQQKPAAKADGVKPQPATATKIPVANIPVTGIPVTGIPVTGIPVTGIPVTGIPVTGIPVTGARKAVVR
jgi:hypothetical protein